MAGTRNQLSLLPSRVASDSLSKPGQRVLDDLVGLADEDLPVSDLSRKMFLVLRKLTGTPDLVNHLLGIQYLAHRGDVPGARLLAAYLDVTTAGARLIPHVRNFNSCRRQQLYLDHLIGHVDGGAKEWQIRGQRLSGVCKAFPLPGEREEAKDPWARMGMVLSDLLADVITGEGIPAASRTLLVDLLRLETDAWEERISRLAGTVNPFRITAVQRVLPILGQADMKIRELRQLILWVEDGLDHQAFIRQGFRALEVLEENEFNSIYDSMKNELKLQAMAGLHRGARDNPLTMVKLGLGVGRLMALDSRFVQAGYKDNDLDLLSAVSLVQQHARGKRLAMPFAQEQEILLEELLKTSEEPEAGAVGRINWSLDGFTVESNQLILDIESQAGELLAWPHGLPSPEDSDPFKPVATIEEVETPDEVDEKKVDLDASAIKHLVMSNIMSISLLLGFLRNPKVTAVPGLVAAVAERTRNPQIIETIATDRTLYSGFANREVPLVCLRSPCNVPPKTLRKFIHVKFVSKIDLKRMANDRTGIRKEIVREIKLYLDALS